MTYRPVEMWWHTRSKPEFVFRRNGRVHLNRRGASVQSTTGSRGVRISGSNAGYTMFRGSVKSTGYPLHSPVSPSLPLPCVTVCHHIATGLYRFTPIRNVWSSLHQFLWKCQKLESFNSRSLNNKCLANRNILVSVWSTSRHWQTPLRKVWLPLHK
jgi:hypothetical protein